ncbi:DUF3142 domain-containing protein [Cerasicoccus arenae]|uniref:DUF3142 domain-containing protein n=1 Tax=Cerasicoccus arenae TaxID=424488 RepID=UPI001677682D|nr:DUF3142 domain-containing protein [Cerasicoccus arenae]MBK1859781.1 DUF3142 domain-containing protein [Cerasicoccus arenae]
MNGLSVLAAEITPTSDRNYVVSVAINYEALLRSQLPITLVVRVGSYPGPFNSEAETTQCLLDTVRKVLAESQRHGLIPLAIEIDFDAATSKLEGYRSWLKQLRAPLGNVSLSLTTLPTWMTRPNAFAELVKSADHFVLQAHSIKRPDYPDDAIELCNAEQALAWAAQAATFDRPFQLALPTYAYQLAFDATGKLVEVSGENLAAALNSNWDYRIVRADPGTMAQVVHDLGVSTPPNCQGIIWYRMPIVGDLLNWDAVTWKTVITGHSSKPSWQVEAVAQINGSIEIQVVQTSPVASPPPQTVIVQWADAKAQAWDGQRNYIVDTTQQNELSWHRTNHSERLPQGTRWTVGWLRINPATELKISISP